MNKIYGVAAAGILLAMIATGPAASASLLGGLINTGADSGNSGDLVSNNSNGSIGVGGANGASVNLGGLTGGLGDGGGLGGLTGGLSGGGGNVGAPGVAEISTGTSGDGGTQAGVSLLGGGGTSFSVNPLGLLGNGGGTTVTLPGLGGGNGTPGTPGAPGTPGIAGLPGGNGIGGLGGLNGFNGLNGRNGVGPGIVIPTDASSRLRSILAMLAQRDWIRMVNGRAICLANFGTAEISSWLPQRDWAGLNAALPQYAQDIATLRELLANCRSPAQRQALNVRDLNRVIGVDVGRNGMPVLYML